MSEKLLPCPFCGSPRAKPGSRDRVVFTYCGDCYAEGPGVQLTPSVDQRDAARSEATRLWNTRSPAPPPQE